MSSHLRRQLEMLRAYVCIHEREANSGVVLVYGELRLKSPTYLCSIYRVAPNQILHAMTSIILVHASPLFQGLCYRVPRGFRVEGSPFLLENPKSRHLRKFLFYHQQSHISIQNLKSSPCNFIPNI